ncbi:MAG: hypothetical protein ACFFBD_17060 [Candidatus Hodarchaeota archaeon]
MYFSENWAFFCRGSKVLWSFGLPQETAGLAAGLASGLDNLGRESVTLRENIASIELFDKRRRPPKKQEIFIVAHGDFYFVASDPLVTSKLLKQEEQMPQEVDDIVRGVLVGQAAILYAGLWTSATGDATKAIDNLYKDALQELGIKEKPDVYVEEGMCSFGGLNLPELLFLHSYIRGRLKEIEPIWNPWGFVIDKNGVPIYLIHNFPESDEMFIMFLSSIYNFIETVFEACPISLVFGGQKPRVVKLFMGEQNILAACNPLGLLNDTLFLEKYGNLRGAVNKDLNQNIKEWIISQLAEAEKHYLAQLDLANLLNIFHKKVEVLDPHSH